MKAIIQALKIPSTYKVTRFAKGHVAKQWIEVAELHSGTAGHQTVYAKWKDGSWSEINQVEFVLTVKSIFDL